MLGLKTSLRRRPALLALAVVSLALPALAGDEPAAAPQEEQTAAQANATAAPVAAAGLVAYIDPVTGGITSTPTEAQREEMRAALAGLSSYSQEGLFEVELPDGTVVMDLQHRFLDFAVVQLAPDGTRSFSCVSGVLDAVATPPSALTPGPPAAAAAE